jgi:protein AATF/BFR2
MVPVPLGGGAWHEAQIDELFASLLGKGYEMAGDDVGEVGSPGKAVVLSDDAGFRIFG